MQTKRANCSRSLFASAAKMAGPAMVACLALAAAMTAGGATLNWSGDLTQLGGNIWSTSAANFNGGSAWTNTTAGNRAVFAGPVVGDGFVFVRGPISLNRLTLNLGGYSFAQASTGGSLNFVGTAPQLLLDSGVTTFDVPISVASSATLLVNGGGTFAFGSTGPLFVGAPDINLGGGTTMDLNQSTATVGSFTLTSGTVANGKLEASSYTLRAGTVTAELDGTGGLTKDGTGTVTLGAQNRYQGNTTVLNGTLKLAADGALSKGSLVEVSGGTLSLSNGFAQSVQRVTVDGGRVLMGGRTSSLNSASGVLLSNSGTLLGTGAVYGGTTVGKGGVLAPGGTAAGSVGTLTLDSLVLNGGGSYNYDSHFTGTAWNHDLLKVTGLLDLTGLGDNKFLLNVSADAVPTVSSFSWHIASFGTLKYDTTVSLNSLFTINLPSTWGDLSASRFLITQSGNYLDLTMNVPEPKAYAMFLGAITLGLVGYRRWRRTALAA